MCLNKKISPLYSMVRIFYILFLYTVLVHCIFTLYTKLHTSASPKLKKYFLYLFI